MNYERILKVASKEIISSDVKESLLNLFQKIPSTFWAALECRFIPNSPEVDFMFAIRQNSEEQEDILEWIETNRKQNQSINFPVHDKLEKTILKWKNPKHFYFNLISFIWLEYDIKDSQSPAHPFLFAVLKPFSFDQEVHNFLLLKLAKETSLTASIPSFNLLDFLLRSFPSGLTVYALGFPDSRRSDQIRLVIKSSSLNLLGQYLLKIDFKEAENLIERLSPFVVYADNFLLHLDIIKGQINEKVGLELVFDDIPSSKKLQSTLELLGDKFQMTDKMQAIKMWDRVLEMEREKKVQLYSSYLKIVWTRKETLHVKAYLFAKEFK